MGRNFPSSRGLLDTIREDLERVKRVIKDPKVSKAIDEIVNYLHSEAGAISISRNPLVTMLILLIAKLMVIVNDGGDNNRC